ncbi:MAG: nucleotide exchange factor GrpE [Myxococcales bacterium]|nr:nucleotide exchange factor GrpE [Myxococcales bacterium]
MQGESRQAGGASDQDASDEPNESGPESGTSSAGSPEDGATLELDPLEQAQAEAARMKEAWIRTAADFDNFRKRVRRELEDAKREARERLLKALLPVFDNLERAIQSALRSSDVKAVAEGLAMVQRQFVDSLGKEGISRVGTVGLPFDPSVHEAIQQVETGDHPAGTVIAEVQPGYTQGDRLLRPAMVVVAKAKSGDGVGRSDEAAS